MKTRGERNPNANETRMCRLWDSSKEISGQQERKLEKTRMPV